nr:histidine phosphatase family protein [Nocardioides thalensis]
MLRHGRTEWNATHRIQGQLDPGLDDTGRAEARAVAPVVAALGPAVLWSSDLARARETAEQVAAASRLVPTYDERLREFHLGERQGLTHAEYERLAPEEFARFRAGEWDEVPGAEHPEAAAKRYAAALHDLLATLAPGETGVVVSHGAVTRTGLVSFLGWPRETARDLRALGNCARVELHERAVGRWALAAYNVLPVVE